MLVLRHVAQIHIGDDDDLNARGSLAKAPGNHSRELGEVIGETYAPRARLWIIHAVKIGQTGQVLMPAAPLIPP